MLEYARHQKVPKFILASTSSLYGEDGTAAQRTRADRSSPRSLRGKQKGAEAFAYSYHHLYKIDIACCAISRFMAAGVLICPCSVFASGSRGQTVTITGDGSQSRGFTYVDDIASGTLLALKKVGYEVFNLGGHEVISINDLVSMLEEMIGKPALRQYIPAHPADVYSNVADVSKARQMLGWQPQIGLEEGVRRLVDWYRSNRPWAKDIITD